MSDIAAPAACRESYDDLKQCSSWVQNHPQEAWQGAHCRKVPDVNISVMKFICWVFGSSQES